MTSVNDTWEWLRPALALLADHDQPWDQRRERALEQLGVQAPHDHPVTAELFQELDAMPENDRDNLDEGQLEQLAHPIVERSAAQAAGQAGTPTADGGYDEAAWQAFLAENGPRWDGTEDSWQAFRDWFAYSAAEQGFGQPADALLAYLDPQSPNDRIAAFAQYGVTIAATASAGAAQPAGEAPPAQMDEEELAALAAQLAEIPGIENMTEDEIDQILSGAITEGGNN